VPLASTILPSAVPDVESAPSSQRAHCTRAKTQRAAAGLDVHKATIAIAIADSWTPPATLPGVDTVLTTAESDAMHAVLMRRADALQGCSITSGE